MEIEKVKREIEENILIRLLQSSQDETKDDFQKNYQEKIQDHHISILLYEEIHSYLQTKKFSENEYVLFVQEFLKKNGDYHFEDDSEEDKAISILYEIIQYPTLETYIQYKI